MPSDLWPDFDLLDVPRSPKTVIDEAGEGLYNKTGGAIKLMAGSTSIKNDQVEIAYTLWASRIRYHFPFMRVSFAVAPTFPVRLTPDKLPEVVANNEAELISALGGIFHAPATVETVRTLLSLG